MNSQVASYYRAILFADGQDSSPLPKSLLTLHTFAEKRHQALGLGSTITKATALAIALTWLSSTDDGRKFTSESTNLGDMFGYVPESRDSDAPSIDWDGVSIESPVIVMIDGKPTQGLFMVRRGGWLDILVDGKERSFRTTNVKLAGA